VHYAGVVRGSSVVLWLAVGSAIAGASACGDDATDPTDGAGAGATVSGSGGASSSASQTASSSSTGVLPPIFDVTGVVVDQNGEPVDQAIVMQGGGARSMLTGPDGAFTWTLTDEIAGPPVIVAAKTGYRTAGEELELVPDGPVTLTLYAASPPDNEAYTWGHPGVGDPSVDTSTAFCGHCHTTFAAEFNASAHARATRDPRVQDLYAGVASAIGSAAECASAGGVWRVGRVPGSPAATAPRCYVGFGALPDLNGCGGPAELACDNPALPAPSQPTAFGACADCHALGMDGPLGGRDLLDAEGIGFEFGNHCDACHKVSDIDIDAPPGAGGRLVMQRPREKIGDPIQGMTRQVMFGPYPDVPIAFMGGSYQPKFSTAELCAGCHEHKQAALVLGGSLDPARWPDGLPTHATYTEWQDGPFTSTPCQGCHMPPKNDLFNAVDVSSPELSGIAGGFQRSPDQIRSHSFRGPLAIVDGMPRLLSTAATLDLVAGVMGGAIEVTATVENIGCGHALPTGEPMRALVLVVQADACGALLAASAGSTIDDVGGERARGLVGVDASVVGTTVTWPEGAAVASPGQVVRVVRATGGFVDYEGIGLFADPMLTADAKGLPLEIAVGRAVVVAVAGADIAVDAALGVQAGDRVVIADSEAAPFVDGEPSRALAGASGLSFGKILVDPAGRRRVPHHRAVDIVRDNRIAPTGSHTTAHTFAFGAGCTESTVKATLLYRPHPLDLSTERGWEARDYVVVEELATVPLP